MIELLGAPKMNSNFFSLFVRFLYALLLMSGWCLFIFTNYSPLEGTDPFVWVVAVAFVVGLPVLWITARIEQYWLHAIWGLGMGKAVAHFLSSDPELQLRWQQVVSDPVNAGDKSSPVAQAIRGEEDKSGDA